jgi:hypothetical protein
MGVQPHVASHRRTVELSPMSQQSMLPLSRQGSFLEEQPFIKYKLTTNTANSQQHQRSCKACTSTMQQSESKINPKPLCEGKVSLVRSAVAVQTDRPCHTLQPPGTCGSYWRVSCPNRMKYTSSHACQMIAVHIGKQSSKRFIILLLFNYFTS